MAQSVLKKHLPTRVWIPQVWGKILLEKEMSSVFAHGKSTWTGDPGGLQAMGFTR